MAEEKTDLQQRIESGRRLLLAEIAPPHGSDPAAVRDAARRLAGKVHALGVSDNRRRVCMSAVAAATLAAAEGVEVILHVVTRDRNRIALVSDYLGARALGIRNLLCTSGTHQTLGRFRAAKNVFDVDSIQLLQTYAGLGSNGSLVGEDAIDVAGPVCLGAAADPCADPIDLQLVRVAKKISAGAQFLITQPVYDVERFEAWFTEVTRRGLHEKVAIVAGIQPLGDAESAAATAAERPSPLVPDAVLKRIASAAGPSAQRTASIEIAAETIQRLSQLSGLRGFEICAGADTDSALEVIEKSALGTD